MAKRMTRWVAGLAAIAGLRKLMMTQAAAYEARLDSAEVAPGDRLAARIERQAAAAQIDRKAAKIQRKIAKAERKAARMEFKKAAWLQRKTVARAMPFGFLARQKGFRFPWQRRRSMSPLQLMAKAPRQFMDKLPRQFMDRLPGQRRTSRLTMLWPLLLGLGLGATLMYVFNARGNSRRALQRDEAMRFGADTTAGYGSAGYGASGYRAAEQGATGAAASGGTIARYTTSGFGAGEQQGAQARSTQTPSAQTPALSRQATGQFMWEGRAGDIPRGQWDHFCERFGEQHRGRAVTMETQSPDGSASIIAQDQPLIALSNEQEGGFDLRVVLGSEATETLAHNITGVESLRLETNDTGSETLHVRSADGTTVVRFA